MLERDEQAVPPTQIVVTFWYARANPSCRTALQPLRRMSLPAPPGSVPLTAGVTLH